MRRLISIFGMIVLTGCIGSQEKWEKSLIARWEMERVFDDGKDVTQEHNPSGNRWIEFRSDGSFISGGDPYGENAGTYSVNYEPKTLFIDSDAGADDDSQWIVEIDGDKMTWQGTGVEWAERFKLIHKRSR